MGVIPNPKIAFIFPILCILALIFPILIKYFPKCEEKGSFLKSQIKSLTPFYQNLPVTSAILTLIKFKGHNFAISQKILFFDSLPELCEYI